RVDAAHDREAGLGLAVGDGVAADDRGLGAGAGVVDARHDLGEGGEGELVGGEADEGEGDLGAAAHGPDVAERVGGGDGAEGARVVDDGGDDVDGEDERA